MSDRCWRCGIPWNDWAGRSEEDPTRCRPCYGLDSDPEIQRDLHALAAENKAKRRAEAAQEAAEYGVPLDVALAVRGEKP